MIIGAGAKILGGCIVGSNAIIGANAVVISDIPQATTAVGVPAKISNSSPRIFTELLEYSSCHFKSATDLWRTPKLNNNPTFKRVVLR